MGFHRFLAYDPYLSFAEGERGVREKIFLRPDGIPSASWYDKKADGRGYLSSLWRIGRNAYAVVAERLGKQPTANDFEAIARSIRELEKELAPELDRLIQDGRLVLHECRDSPPITCLATVMKEAPDGWLLEVFMRTVRPSVVSGHLSAEDLPDFEGLLCGAAVMYVDDYIIADNLASADMDFFHDLIQVNIASANLYRETLEAAKEAASAIGRRSAEARHKPTNQLKAALLSEWDATASEYESRADFARIVSQREGVKYRTLYDWIAAHDRTKA